MKEVIGKNRTSEKQIGAMESAKSINLPSQLSFLPTFDWECRRDTSTRDI